MSLTKCMGKLKIDPLDQSEIRQIASEYEKEGMSQREAAGKAVDDMIEMAIDEYNEFADKVAKKGGYLEKIEVPKKKPKLRVIDGEKPDLSRKSLARKREPSSLRFRFVEKEVSRIAGKLGLSDGVSIEVAESENALPGEIIEQAAKEGALGEIVAVHRGKSIYVVADRIDSVAELEEAILHEAAHYGGRQLFGAQWRKSYTSIWFSVGGIKGLKKLAKKLGFAEEFESYVSTASKQVSEGEVSARDRAVYLTDEFLAHAQGRKAYRTMPGKVKQAIQEFFGAIRNALRSAGLMKTAEMSESDLAFLLRHIHKAARQNGEASSKSASFMRFSKTRSFEEWFGNSVVKDPDGDPLPVYHGGLGIGNIDRFDPGYGGMNTGNNEVGAFYFTKDREIAEDYARESFIRKYEGNEGQLIEDDYITEEELDDVDLYELADQFAEMQKVFVRLENPLILDMKGGNVESDMQDALVDFLKTREWNEASERYMNEILDLIYDDYAKEDIEYYRGQIEERARDNHGLEPEEEIEDYMFEDATREIMDENGIEREEKDIDGLVVRNVIDSVSENSHWPTDTFIVLDPVAIKSVENRGTWSNADDRIMFSRKQGKGSSKNEDKKWAKWEPEITSTGKIKGAPQWVKDRKDHNRMRRLIKKLLDEGMVGRFWYEESARSVMEIVDNDVVEAERFIQLLAIYSPQANVQVNTQFAISAWNQWKNGAPTESFKVKTAKQDEKAVDVLYNNKPFEGRKTNSFYLNLMHDIVVNNPDAIEKLQLEEDLLEELDKPATIDMWMYRAFGYANEAAGDDKGSGAYSFAENETRRLAAKLNLENPDGERWTPHQVQAAIWTSMKARYELPWVKAATWAKSIRKGYATTDEQGKPTIEGIGAERLRKHRHIWREQAMRPTSKEATEFAEENSASFREFIEQNTRTVTWEAIPSPSLGSDVYSASKEVQQRFTSEAKALLVEDGVDLLATKLGTPLAFVGEGAGGYESAVSPNNLSHIVPTKEDGAFGRDEARAYAQAIQYVFKQDAVPWFRADKRALISKDAKDKQKFRVVNKKNGKTVPRSKVDTLTEAQAIADGKGDGYEVRGGPYARAVALRFENALNEKTEQSVLKLLGEGGGFTKTSPNEILIINFRDDDTGVPFVDDEQFSKQIDAIEDDLQDLGITDIGDLWIEGEYGYVHDWKADPEGQAVLEKGIAGRRPDLQPWLRDRREAFEALLEEYSGERLELREQEVKLLQAKGPEEDSPIRFSRKKRTPGRKYDKRQKAALDKGRFGAKASVPFKEDFKEKKHRLSTKLRQGIVDQYASFKDILKDNRAWMMAQLTGSSNGALEAAIDYGVPYMKEGAVAVNVKEKSLKEILSPLGEELDDWLAWMAGNRADRLAQEDKERLFSDVDIDALKSLNQGKMKDGSQRGKIYNQVRDEFEAMNAAINQIGVDTGLIGKEEADAWAKQGFYIPFYRMMEEEGEVRGPKMSGGLVRQKAYKKLKGADIPLNDLMTNVLMNWSHILGASLRNQAGAAALDSAASMGLAEEVYDSIQSLKAAVAEGRADEETAQLKSKKSIWVMRDGKQVWYELDDSQEGQLVLNALMNLNWSGLNNFAMKFMRKMKRVFTLGVTMSPEFRIANLLRDSIHSIAVVDMSTNIAKNVAKGWKATNKKSETLAQMIAGGGAFGNSGYIYGADPDAIKRLVGRGVGRESILTRNYLYKFFDKYQDFGARMENINRAAAFEKKLNEDGSSLLEANFEARDLLDFSRTGAFEAVRMLTQVVPFLNARMQGLDKMGRSVKNKQRRKQFLAVVGIYSIASVALYLAMRNDPDYEEAEDWERDAYHLFKLPGSDIMYRLPRPFEVGLIATLLERAAEQAVNDKVHGELFAERLWHGIRDTLSINPVPQAFLPAVELWANKDTFTGRTIESMGMDRMSPSERKKAWTSRTAILASEGMDKISWGKVVLSPVQIEHLVNGYLGWAGATVLGTVDTLVTDPVTDTPSAPKKHPTELPVLKRFAREGQAKYSRYTTQFYDNLREVTHAWGDIRQARKFNELEKEKALLDEHKDKLKTRKFYNRVQRQLSKIRKEMTKVRLNRELSPMQKREKMKELRAKLNRTAKLAVDKTDSAFH